MILSVNVLLLPILLLLVICPVAYAFWRALVEHVGTGTAPSLIRELKML
jgi:hypothetical protein